MDKQKLILLVVPNAYPNPVDLTPQLKPYGLGDGWRIQQVSATDFGGGTFSVAVVLESTEDGELPPAEAF
jgi:hypothetical protein